MMTTEVEKHETTVFNLCVIFSIGSIDVWESWRGCSKQIETYVLMSFRCDVGSFHVGMQCYARQHSYTEWH